MHGSAPNRWLIVGVQIIFYAPVLFSSIGNGSSVTLENTCIIGAGEFPRVLP